MLDLLVLVFFCWLFFKGVKLAFKVTWGVTKFIAMGLFVIAWPILIGCLMFAGGLLLVVPIALIGLAFGLLKTCV